MVFEKKRKVFDSLLYDNVHVLQCHINMLPEKSNSSKYSMTGVEPTTDDFSTPLDWNGFKWRLATNMARRKRLSDWFCLIINMLRVHIKLHTVVGFSVHIARG